MRLEFLNKSNNEAFARTVASAFAVQLNPTMEELAEIKTAISEAVTNSIIHGYDGLTGTVHMEGKIEGDTIYFKITDYGHGIPNIAIAMEPLYTGKPELERSGMGFTIMDAFMDTIKVESKEGEGTIVKMSKKIGKGDKYDR